MIEIVGSALALVVLAGRFQLFWLHLNVETKRNAGAKNILLIFYYENQKELAIMAIALFLVFWGDLRR